MFPLADLRIDEGLWVPIIVAIVSATAVYYCARVFAESRTRRHIATLDAQSRENQDRLKALMIQRGMSADEIERILLARAPSPPLADQADPSDAEQRIVTVLSENGYEGADVEQILAAARAGNQLDTTVAKMVETLAENWTKGPDIVRILKARRGAAPA